MSRPVDPAQGSRLKAQGCVTIVQPSAFSLQPSANGERGIALLIVVSVLTVIGIMGVAFVFSMYLETQATRQFVSTTQARYLAESGVNHARALLDEDRLGSRVDDLAEEWTRDLAGQDADIDGDGTPDARWWLVRDARQRTIGRYATQIADEGGKVNLNAALADPAMARVDAINLTALLEAIGIDQSRAGETAARIETYRYGEDGKPGKAGSDDDGDGTIDEPDEYQPLALRGDDRQLEGLEDLVSIAGLTAQEAAQLARLATVYSWDLNVSATGKLRFNVNTATASELLSILLDVGVQNPWQSAVNIADYADSDFELSRISKSSQTALLANQGSMGSWNWQDAPVGHYESSEPNGEKLSWSVSAPAGRMRMLARGVSGMKIGDVTVAGQLHSSVDDGESLGIVELSGTLDVEVVNREPAGTLCGFRGLELVSEDTRSAAVPVRGVEAVRFNELMVDPTLTLDVSSAVFDPQGSDWVCPAGAGVCSSSGVGQGRWSWTSNSLQAGRYHLRVFGSASGQTVGEVRVEGPSVLLVHGQRYPSTVMVGSDGKITLTIGKTQAGQTYYVKGVSLSLQPDAEYVELMNLSGEDIDVQGWTVEGELTGGRQASLPAGAVIKAHGMLVAAVDLDDRQATLADNGIEARSVWQIPQEANAVQLNFPSGAPSADDDWLKIALPSGSVRRLMLRTNTGVLVDEVQYPLPPLATAAFQSLEKGDPTVIGDRDSDGIDEGWYPSLKLYTPGMPNDNEGLKQLMGLETMTHDPSQEVALLNRPLAGVGELAGVPSGEAWKPFASADLAKLVDRLTVEGHRLEAEGHAVDTGAAAAWEEKAGGVYLHTDPQQADAAGRWEWTALSDGAYRLSLYGCDGCLGEQMAVRWARQDGTWTDWSPALTSDAQGRVSIGQVTIGMDGTPAGTLIVEVRCVSPDGVCHFDYVRLDPRLIRVGPVNVNTAPEEVLLALPGMTQTLAKRIIDGRPYGDQGGKGRGIGDLLIGEVLAQDEEGKLAAFRRLAHLFTTRSDVFQIVSLGQAMEGDRATATQQIRTVIQR